MVNVSYLIIIYMYISIQVLYLLYSYFAEYSKEDYIVDNFFYNYILWNIRCNDKFEVIYNCCLAIINYFKFILIFKNV